MQTGLCRYKDIFGKPNTGVHSYRFFDIAIADVMLTILAAFILSYALSYPFWPVLGGLFLFGIFCHHLFCVRTTVDKFLFPNA
jgi:hypothetical protein